MIWYDFRYDTSAGTFTALTSQPSLSFTHSSAYAVRHFVVIMRPPSNQWDQRKVITLDTEGMKWYEDPLHSHTCKGYFYPGAKYGLRFYTKKT